MIQELLYELRHRELEEHKREPEVYWITDLCRCPLKRDFELRYPELTEANVYNPHFIIGDLVHMGLVEVLKRARAINLHNFEIEAEIENSRELIIGNKRAIVKGRVDVIMRSDNEKIGIEIKTSKRDTKIPHENHIQQCRLYLWLFDLDYMLLLYLTPDRITEYKIEKRASEEEVISLLSDRTAPRYTWECSYCLFAVMCPNKITG
ncbi:MAG: CRISPR-associated protein Cas4 [Thermoprotei archaeon]|nr:MAG: CRISPR-associated protein Cas4 [Thermoprotei archaeon]